MTAPPRVGAATATGAAPRPAERPDEGAEPLPRGTRADRALRSAVLVAALAFVACYLAVAFARFDYPYQLEWLEGGVLGHVTRVLHGEGLYGAPSLRFTPYLYTPLYYFVSAGAAWVFGLHLSTLRMVSIAASLVTLAAVYRLVWLETRNRWAAVVAAGVLAACFRLSGAWFDLARVDSLFVALLFVGLLCVRRTTTTRAAALAGVVLAAAYFTKQSALLPSLAVLPFLWWRDRRLAVVYAASFGGLLAATTLWFDHATGGWFGQYTIHLAGQHALLRSEFVGFWTHDLVRPLGVALIVGAVGLLAYRRGDAGRFWIPVTGGLLLASYTARLHTGGYDNVLLPAYGGVALVTGLGLHALTFPGVVRRHRATVRIVLVAVVAMFASLAYNPFRQVPSASTARAGDRLVADLGRLPAPVYLPSQSWLLDRAHPGTPTTAQAAALDDIFRGHVRGSNRTLARTLRGAVAERRFASIVVDSPSVFSYLPGNLVRSYCKVETLPRRDRLEPVTGTITAPASVWMPRGPATRCIDDGLRWHVRVW